MIVQSERIVKAWFNNVTYGVNPQFVLMKAAGLFGTDDTPPDIVYIGCTGDDEAVAEWQDPPNLPAIYITIASPMTLEGEVFTIKRVDAVVTLDLIYIAAKADMFKLFRDVSHTLRAMVRSLAVMNENEYQPNRTLEGIILESCKVLRLTPWDETIKQAKAVGIVQAEFEVDDLNPGV